jgi:predicted transcriptional regulator
MSSHLRSNQRQGITTRCNGLAMKSGGVVSPRSRAADCYRSTGIASRPLSGYTSGMKTAVSIPDDVFEDAERLASRLRTSRSQLYARALAEFVARHDDDRVTSLMDQAVREAGGEADAFVQAAAQQSLQRVEW